MRGHCQAPVAVGGKREAGSNVFSSQVGEIVEDLGDTHAAPKIIENVGDRDACPSDARLAAANARVNGNPLSVIHRRILLLSKVPSSGVANLRRRGSAQSIERFAAEAVLFRHEGPGLDAQLAAWIDMVCDVP